MAELAVTLAAAALVVALLNLLVVAYIAVRMLRSGRRRGKPRTSGADLEGLITAQSERIDALRRELSALDEHVRRVEDDGRRAVARVGVVRFNPFEDTGGNQSFAVALLDRRDDGIVISSLHSRQQTRLYLKSITGGRAEAALSAEEAEALRRATGGKSSQSG